ncbi:MAG TPA: YidC/Oxa1 family insertase periplasmic-domain containing protein [Tepidisphaeraceae bacterium]|nr:YidC/Oxa1 family insertase periplasmic-domain containing protein [Tepidisphaeraceae bacterium]
MENRRLLIAMAVGLAAILLWVQFRAWLDHHYGWDKLPLAQQATTQPTTAPTTNPSSQPTTLATTAPTTAPAGGGPTLAGSMGTAHVVPTTQPSAGPQAVAIGLANPKNGQYALQVTVDPKGAGFGSVVLNAYSMTAGKKSPPYRYQEPPPQQPDFVPLASRNITVDKVTYDLAGLDWNLLRQTPIEAIYGADLVDHGKTILEIRKDFTVSPESDPDKGYEVRIGYSFRNLTDKPLVIRTAFNGPVVPPEETRSDREVFGGYLENQNILYESHRIEDFKPEKDKNTAQITLTTDSKGRHARWAGAVSNYFGAVVMPENMQVDGKDKGNADYIDSIVAQGVNLQADLTEERNAYLTFQTKDITVAPGQTTTLPLSVFVGPKWREVLETTYYTSFPRMYNVLLVIRGMCGMSWCSFGWLAEWLDKLLWAIHIVVRDWGLAIMVLVAIVRLVLHPITRQSQISMAKMQKMGPEMKRLQEKYKDDKDALNRAMMDFHKQQGLGPYLGCLPMFLQMPIWVALYGVLLTTFELRHAPFLWGLTWIKDLSQPDYIWKFAHPVTLIFGMHLYGIAILPILLAAVMMLQQQFMPKPVAASPEQMKQQKMMQYVSPLMFLLIFYTYPSGLNLYVFASTGVGVLESKIVRDHLKAREEAEKGGRVFVETKPTRGSRKSKPVGPQQPAKNGGPVGWLTSRWAKLLEQAEQVRKDNEKRGKK